MVANGDIRSEDDVTRIHELTKVDGMEYTYVHARGPTYMYIPFLRTYRPTGG